MELSQMLTLSTAHITPATSTLMESESFPISVWRCNFGFMVYSGHALDMMLDMASNTLPPDLLAVLEFGQANGADFVRFDCDGNEVDGLPVYDWESANA